MLFGEIGIQLLRNLYDLYRYPFNRFIGCKLFGHNTMFRYQHSAFPLGFSNEYRHKPIFHCYDCDQDLDAFLDEVDTDAGTLEETIELDKEWSPPIKPKGAL